MVQAKIEDESRELTSEKTPSSNHTTTSKRGLLAVILPLCIYSFFHSFKVGLPFLTVFLAQDKNLTLLQVKL
jgi:hypothetical protein